MLKPYKDPYGYKKLLAYQKAEAVQICCGEITKCFPKTKTLLSLADQMDRSARSGKQNIVEGWKRNTTKEYYDFLGFSIGAIAELEEDCNDVWKGFYSELMGLRGVMGERGRDRDRESEIGEMGEREKRGGEIEMGEMGERGRDRESEMGEMRERGTEGVEMGVEIEMGKREIRGEMGNPLNPLAPFGPLDSPFDIEKLKFYPLDETLPPIVKLKLRCKELNFMLHRLQESLLAKMQQEKTLPTKDKVKMMDNQAREGDDAYAKILEQMGLETLENGEVVKRGEK